MSLKIGIVGLPNAGKSTLFNALLKRSLAATAPHPFTTIDKNVGVVPVPDELLDKLHELTKSQKVTPATINFVDIAGLVKGAHKGEGLGNQFLSHIKEVDLIIHLVRGFTHSHVPHVHSKIDPDEDIEIIKEELTLFDLSFLEKQIEHFNKDPKKKDFVQKIYDALNSGRPLPDDLSFDFAQDLRKELNLLSLKPVLYVLNTDESDLSNASSFTLHVSGISLSAKLEEDLSKLSLHEQKEFLELYNLDHSRVDNLIKKCYEELELITFYTIKGDNETRAWPIKKGKTALDAANLIHTDFAKGFIKAEVIKVNELISIGSWQKAHEKGLIILAGKDYIVENGNLIEFKIGQGG